MQAYPCPPNQAYNNPQYGGPQQPYNYAVPPNNYCPPPPNYGYPAPPYNNYPVAVIPPGSSFNTGGNSNGSGIQKNGDVKFGNKKEKSGGVDIGKIGGNHGNNEGGQQVAGDITLGDIGCNRC
ncbi:cell wall protein qid3-like [Amaranthus tricolor]|uniref:cell wall protein qid3-like n=1 Tax=Amaranthus tricolor TaxID=29722 RepID=UPI002583A04D|nr:cell wall protein qid3-like [Amaranthus tricolor]